MSETDEYKTLKVYASLPEAEIVKGFLIQNGVEVELLDKHMNSMYGSALGGVLGGYRLQVKTQMYSKALELLRSKNLQVEEGFLMGEVCPKCQSQKTEQVEINKPNWLKQALSLSFFKKKKAYWKCVDCQNTWTSKGM